MKKFYTLLAAAVVTLSASAADRQLSWQKELNTAPVAKKEFANGSLKSASVVKSAKKIAGKANDIRPLSMEDGSIEGIWEFYLGDYYFGDDSVGDTYANFEATIEDNLVWFEDVDGVIYPFYAEYDEATGTLTFNKEYLGTVSDTSGNTYYVYQNPYFFDMSEYAQSQDFESALKYQTITAAYLADLGVIQFESDLGIDWSAYNNQAGRGSSLGSFFMYDLMGATWAVPMDEEQAGQWKSVGKAEFVDGWITVSYKFNDGTSVDPVEYKYEVELQQNVNNANLYRLWRPYHNEDWILTSYNQSNYDGQIVFDITDPDHVIVRAGLPAGFKNSNGEFYVFGIFGWQIHNNFDYDDYISDSELQEIIDYMTSKGQAFDTFKDGVVTINAPIFDLNRSCENAYSWNGIDPIATITFPADLGGIDSVLNDNENITPEYYNLQGVRINRAEPGQVVIKKKGTEVTKIVVR